MSNILNIFKGLLLEQDAKLLLLRNAISERKPITIDYRSEDDEVLNGVRYDIEPIVLGTHARSGNLVFWAYVFKGTSKKGLPGWKMFRVDRVNQIKTQPGLNPFKLTDLPGYQKGKAPNAMKSLSKVEIFSPYWFEDDPRFKTDQTTQPAPPKPKTPTQPIQKPTPQEKPQPQPTAEPEKVEPQDTPTSEPQKDYAPDVLNNLKGKVKDIDGQKVVNKQDYEAAVKDLYNRKEGDWKNYQRQVAGNDRAGEGTRARFDKESRTELDTLLSKDNIKVQDENQPENLSETIKRIKTLINSLV